MIEGGEEDDSSDLRTCTQRVHTTHRIPTHKTSDDFFERQQNARIFLKHTKIRHAEANHRHER